MNRRQSGVSLIEVLVTLVLISIGLLGTASLQVLSKRSNYDAVQRTTAAHLANDYLQRMRSNRVSLDGYILDTTMGSGSLGANPDKDCSDDSVTCDNSELANFDLWQWERQLDGAMEQTSGSNSGGLLDPTVCVTGPGGGVSGVYEVAIAWRGTSARDNPTTSACGNDSGKYGNDNEYRHVLVMRTFIEEF